MFYTYDFFQDALRQAEAQLQAAKTRDPSMESTRFYNARNILTLWQTAMKEMDDLQKVSNLRSLAILNMYGYTETR
jgi:hypothetical protein